MLPMRRTMTMTTTTRMRMTRTVLCGTFSFLWKTGDTGSNGEKEMKKQMMKDQKVGIAKVAPVP